MLHTSILPSFARRNVGDLINTADRQREITQVVDSRVHPAGITIGSKPAYIETYLTRVAPINKG